MKFKKLIFCFKLFVSLITFINGKAQTCAEVEVTDSYGNTSLYLNCDYQFNNNCFELTADYTPIPSTESYNVQSIPFNPPIPFNQGNPLKAEIIAELSAVINDEPLNQGIFDDLFSDPKDIGFDFCFFDNVFNEYVIGSNGLISFNLDEARTTSPSGIANSIPSQELVDNSIFGVYHDILFDLDSNADIYVDVIGAAPCRQFIINFYEGQHYQCTETSTTQIVLYELTNVIEVYIESKPLSCDTGRDNNSLLGILNQTGLIGYAPPSRNTGEWEAFQEAWRFEPTGTTPPSIEWFDDNNNLVGTGETVSICDYQSSTYTASVNYSNCNNSPGVIVSASIEVNIEPGLPLGVGIDKFICDSDSNTIDIQDYLDEISVNNPDNFLITLHNTEQEALDNINVLDFVQEINGTSLFYIRIQSLTNSTCFSIVPIQFTVDTLDLSLYPILLCDNFNDGIEENVDLLELVDAEFSELNITGITYYDSLEDAYNSINEITSADVNIGTEIYANVSFAGGCTKTVGPLVFEFLGAPIVPDSPPTVVVEICDLDFNHIEPYDWTSYINNNITNNPSLTASVHTSYENALNNTGITDQISDIWENAFIRITNQNGCFNIVEITLDINFTGVDAVDYTENICFDGTADLSINLNDYVDSMLIDPTTGVTIDFFDSSGNAYANTSPISASQTITADGPRVAQTYYVRFSLSDECYSIKRINIVLVHPQVEQNPIDVCDISNDIQEDNNLNIYDGLILGDQVGSVVYYLTEQDAIDSTNEITNFNFIQDQVLWVRLTVSNCTEVYAIDFNLESVLEVNNVFADLDALCNNNSLGSSFINLTEFEEDIYNGPQEVEFTYHTEYNEQSENFSEQVAFPNLFSISTDVQLFVKVQPIDGGCYSVATLNITASFLPVIQTQPAELYACDPEADLNEAYDLTEANNNIFIIDSNYGISDVDITYYLTQEDANTASDPLNLTYTPNSTIVTIYARVESIQYGCYSTAPLTLNTVAAPKAIAKEYTVCDSNLNGVYDIFLTELDPLVMGTIGTEGLTFYYYTSQEDAENDNNPLDGGQLYEATPFPNTIWVKVENIPNCFDIKPVSISFGTSIPIDNTELNYEICDENSDGFIEFNLEEFIENNLSLTDATIDIYNSIDNLINLENPIQNTTNYTNTIAYNQTLYASVAQDSLCPVLVTINLILNPKPSVQVQDQLLCANNTVDIIPIVNGDEPLSYEWISPSNNILSSSDTLMNASEFGTYQLNVTNAFDCTTVSTFTIQELPLPIIESIEVRNRDIIVTANGVQAIEYSIDGILWQTSNVFNNVDPGVHVLYVRYVREDQICEGEPAETLVLNIFNIITPNGDGENDIWTINNLQSLGEEDTKVNIYDRYGKIIFSQSSNTRIIWDGKINGRALPSTDYWYTLILPDGRKYEGSITLKNY